MTTDTQGVDMFLHGSTVKPIKRVKAKPLPKDKRETYINPFNPATRLFKKPDRERCWNCSNYLCDLMWCKHNKKQVETDHHCKHWRVCKAHAWLFTYTGS